VGGGKEGEGRAAALTEADWEDFQAEVFVEENLEPPLPMMRVLEALATLKPGEKLLVHHVRRPIHLLARLEEEGHAYALKDLGPGQVKLLIRKGG
jgi:TusA-related sulfurtransferase